MELQCNNNDNNEIALLEAESHVSLVSENSDDENRPAGHELYPLGGHPVEAEQSLLHLLAV